MENILSNCKKIHFVGIGGSGMYPLAKILNSKGYVITGSDNYKSDTLERAINDGFCKDIGHDANNVLNVDLVVYSSAIKPDNIEIVTAKKMNIPTIERSVMLGILCSMYDNLIAVAGTHGKTTTTSMLTQVFSVAGADPTAIIGGMLPFLGSNSRYGESQNIICEACEYVDTFLKLNPAIAVILNVEEDHLDYFKNLDGVINSFRKFANKASKLLVVNGDDENIKKCIDGLNKEVLTFGFCKENDYYPENIVYKNGFCESVTIMKHGEKLVDLKMKVPGKHNLLNAMATVCVADYVGIDPIYIANGINGFGGAHRRFEFLGKVNEITVIDDFAHHPTEIKNTLTSAKKMGFNRVIAVFQPHTYSRTAQFLNEFAEVLSISDLTILSEILAVREVNTFNIYSENLAEKINNCVCLKTFEEITDYVEKLAKPGDCIITMSGGNIYVCANMILNRLKDKYKD